MVDFYPIKGWWTKINAKYILRPFLSKLNHEVLLKIIEKNIDWLINFYIFLNKMKLGVLTRFLPICDFNTKILINLRKEKLREWVILDTFDQYSPKFDKPYKIEFIKEIFERNGTKVIFADYVHFNDHHSAVVRAIKQ